MIYVFDVSATIVSSGATLYLLMFPIFTFQASYLIMKKGIATSINLGTFLTLLGTLVRCLAIYGK
jgi:FLVCR family feline leukemia virus subgroup C receptor-related protein